MKLVHGILAMLVTPFDDNYQLNEMGPARPPYMAPDDAADRLRKRLPALKEML